MCRMYPNCEPSVAWRYVAEHPNGRCRALMCFGLRRLARVRLYHRGSGARSVDDSINQAKWDQLRRI
jgi:hypothetical protein